MEYIAPILAALFGGGLVQLFVAFMGRKKTDAETVNIITETAGALVTSVNAEIDRLNAEIQRQSQLILDQNTLIRKLQLEIGILRGEMHRMGSDPDKILDHAQTIVIER